MIKKNSRDIEKQGLLDERNNHDIKKIEILRRKDLTFILQERIIKNVSL